MAIILLREREKEREIDELSLLELSIAPTGETFIPIFLDKNEVSLLSMMISSTSKLGQIFEIETRI